MVRIGTAGWAIPKALADRFPKEGSGLERYSKVLDITEINQTFYRLPRPSTFQKWADTTPENFRFSLKLHRSFTHSHKLRSTQGLEEFCETAGHLERKWHALLIQLPPSLAYEPQIVESFLQKLKELYDGHIAIEPRHESWRDAEEILAKLSIARVAADPARYGDDAWPGGYKGFAYWRLHGSPKIYYSEYDESFLQDLVKKIEEGPSEQVVIFDNTASGAALKNALQLKELL